LVCSSFIRDLTRKPQESNIKTYMLYSFMVFSYPMASYRLKCNLDWISILVILVAFAHGFVDTG